MSLPDGILLLYNRPAFFRDAATITDHIDAFGRFSRFTVTKLNTAGGFPKDLDSHGYAAIVLHYSLFASGPNPYLMDGRFLEYLSGAHDSYKVAFFQDEHEYCRRRFRFLDDYSVDCVYTCFDESDHSATYGKYTEVSRIVTYMPAYVSPEMVAEANRLHRPDADRSIDVGYRTRPTPPTSVAAGWRRWRSASASSRRRTDRAYAWTSARARRTGFTAGAGMSSSLAAGASSAPSPASPASTSRTRSARTTCASPRAGAKSRSTSSSRARSAAGTGRFSCERPAHVTSRPRRCGVCQVMFEGRYNGVLEEDVHFIPLRKDFSNFDDVISRFGDPAVRAQITENAHRDLIASGAYGYEEFIAGFDRVLMDAGLEPDAAPASPHTLRGRPLVPATARYLQGAAIWLERNHPRASKVVLFLLKPAFFAGRQVRKIRNRG